MRYAEFSNIPIDEGIFGDDPSIFGPAGNAARWAGRAVAEPFVWAGKKAKDVGQAVADTWRDTGSFRDGGFEPMRDASGEIQYDRNGHPRRDRNRPTRSQYGIWRTGGNRIKLAYGAVKKIAIGLGYWSIISDLIEPIDDCIKKYDKIDDDLSNGIIKQQVADDSKMVTLQETINQIIASWVVDIPVVAVGGLLKIFLKVLKNIPGVNDEKLQVIYDFLDEIGIIPHALVIHWINSDEMKKNIAEILSYAIIAQSEEWVLHKIHNALDSIAASLPKGDTKLPFSDTTVGDVASGVGNGIAALSKGAVGIAATSPDEAVDKISKGVSDTADAVGRKIAKIAGIDPKTIPRSTKPLSDYSVEKPGKTGKTSPPAVATGNAAQTYKPGTALTPTQRSENPVVGYVEPRTDHSDKSKWAYAKPGYVRNKETGELALDF